MSSFDDAFIALIGNEGSYANNPADPGAETMWGVTARVARAHGYTGPMRDLPLATAKTIAKIEYWDRASCDKLDPRVAFQVFDSIYNGGPAIKWLQLAAKVTPDGVIGPLTLAAVAAVDPVTVITRFNAYRLKYLSSLPTWSTFSRGWTDRIANNLLKGSA